MNIFIKFKRLMNINLKTGLSGKGARRIFLLFYLGMVLSLWDIGFSSPSASGFDDTMLMFVGEDLEVLTIASRREEKVWDAPAIASVITKKQMISNGYLTLGEILSTLPGFYMEEKEGWTKPYLRGLSNSVLFLYDDVPTGSDVSKTLHQLDEELSLTSLKRIEIIRGAGSVLWGADAFSGIVNCVPMTGKDVNGVETGILYSTKGDGRAFYLNTGLNTSLWDVFLSVNGRQDENDDKANVVSLWGNGDAPTLPEKRFGSVSANDSRYIEIAGSVDYRQAIKFSGRFADYCNPYKISEPNEGYSWIEERDIQTGHIRIESNKLIFGKSVLQFSGLYSWLEPEFYVIDNVLEQSEKTYYAEIIFDRSFFSDKGMLTGGMSYRKKNVDNAPAWESYLPEFLNPGNLDQLPRIATGNYDTKLWSLFTQYNQEIGDFDLFAGIRHDNHDAYEDHASYSYGALWKPISQWMVKLIYGTAYRTPFALHILDSPSFSGSLYEEGGKPDLEKIRNISLQVAFKPLKDMKFSLCGFRNWISNHITEDKYAGLSLPNKQKMDGLEFEINLSSFESVDLSANLTLLSETSDEKIEYKVAEGGIYIRPDGTVEKLDDVIISHSNLTGPDMLANVISTFKLNENISLSLRTNYLSSRKTKKFEPSSNDWTLEKLPERWLFDANVLVQELVTGMDMTITFSNLSGVTYKTPGTYHAISGESFETRILFSKKW